MKSVLLSGCNELIVPETDANLPDVQKYHFKLLHLTLVYVIRWFGSDIISLFKLGETSIRDIHAHWCLTDVNIIRYTSITHLKFASMGNVSEGYGKANGYNNSI